MINLKKLSTNLSINSYLKGNFAIENIKLTTSKIHIKNLIKSIRLYQNNAQLFILEKIIKDGYVKISFQAEFDQGGKIKCGGKRHSLSNKGYYFPATIIECENHNLPTAENELFGPVLSVMKFTTEDEAISKMNDNQYGLSSGVYTKDLGRGLRVSKAIRAGITFVNTYRLISPSAPFGGMKDSGYGKEAGIESIKDYTRIKTTWFNTSEKPMADPFTMG